MSTLPECSRCGTEHWNFQKCPPAKPQVIWKRDKERMWETPNSLAESFGPPKE